MVDFIRISTEPSEYDILLNNETLIGQQNRNRLTDIEQPYINNVLLMKQNNGDYIFELLKRNEQDLWVFNLTYEFGIYPGPNYWERLISQTHNVIVVQNSYNRYTHAITLNQDYNIRNLHDLHVMLNQLLPTPDYSLKGGKRRRKSRKHHRRKHRRTRRH
jgi:hypothetical protein